MGRGTPLQVARDVAGALDSRMASVRGSKLKFNFNAGSRAPGNCAASGSLCPKRSK